MHFTLCTSLYALHSMHFTLCSELYALESMHFTLCTALYALHSVHLTLCTSLYALDSVHFTLCTSLYALHTMHFTLCTAGYAFHSMYFTLCCCVRGLRTEEPFAMLSGKNLMTTVTIAISSVVALALGLRAAQACCAASEDRVSAPALRCKALAGSCSQA